MELREACRFLELLRGVSVLSEPDAAGLEAFCREARYHQIQRHLFPKELARLLDTAGEGELISFVDELQVRLLAGRSQGKLFLYGPYCCESLSTLDARLLLSRCGLPVRRATELLAYRSRFPVLSQRQALRDTRTLLALLSGSQLLPPTREIDFIRPAEALPNQTEQPYAEIVSERYAIETEMMEAVRAGNASRAIRDWRLLHQRMDYFKRELGNTLRTSTMSASITRTVLRVAAMEAKVPPVIVDDLTGRVSRKNMDAKTLDEIESNTETLIRELCRAVRAVHRDQTDYLTEAVRHHIEAHYPEDLTVAQLASHFDVPESRLIQHFRAQTGQTPGAFLRQVRLRRGAELLLSTRKPIQEIASQVGIPDANYFTKQFRAEYGKTPSAFRKAKS